MYNKQIHVLKVPNFKFVCQHCSNCIVILDLTPGFSGLGKDNCKTERETFEFWDLVWLILDVCWYIGPHMSHPVTVYI